MNIFYRGYLYESIEWDLYNIGEYFKNKQFKTKDLAEKSIRNESKKYGLEYYIVSPNVIFNELSDGQFKVKIKIPNSVEKEISKNDENKTYKYETDDSLIKKQIGLYRSYYPVEFDSNEKMKLININPNKLIATEKTSRSNIESIKNAIVEETELPPPIIDEDYTILDGHHRVEAAKELNIEKIPAIMIYEP